MAAMPEQSQSSTTIAQINTLIDEWSACCAKIKEPHLVNEQLVSHRLVIN